ncbi:MAG: hypothetical protein FWH27_16975 [Planctomycetaceae bacterium]|nr:hypothetical protein [Planctomycetaceae bacterium]
MGKRARSPESSIGDSITTKVTTSCTAKKRIATMTVNIIIEQEKQNVKHILGEKAGNSLAFSSIGVGLSVYFKLSFC